MNCVSSVFLFTLLTSRFFHLLWPLLTSLQQLLSALFSASVRSSTVRRLTFFPYICIIYICCIRSVYRNLFCLANSSYKMFVFLRPEICRRLPSNSTSQWTPLPGANGWQLITPIYGLAPSNILAIHGTPKKGTNQLF